MIQTFPDSSPDLEWASENQNDEQHVARGFLQGERSLAVLQNDQTTAAVLEDFLRSAGDEALEISEALTGEVRVTASHGSPSILITGKTAEVLRSYIEGDSVSVSDRMDMTFRRNRI